MEIFTLIFLGAIGASLGLRFWLGLRNLVYMGAHRGQVPEAFGQVIGTEAHAKAADYTAAKTRLQLIAIIFNGLLLLGWTLGGGLDLLDALWRNVTSEPIPLGIAVILSVGFLMAVFDLPFSIYGTFWLEARFGFNRTTPQLFMIDLLKGGVLLFLFGGTLSALILWVMVATGPYWWTFGWLTWVGFSLLQLWAYPRLIAPLFNRFSPLADETLKGRIERLAKRIGFAIRDVRVMDGSRRSAHGNAHFTGIGRNKRIVLFDTLVETLSPDEAEAVLAHELGHFKLHHVRNGFLLGAGASLLGFALLGVLLGQPWFYSGLGVTVPSNHLALLLFAMAGPVFAFFLTPFLAAYSRRHEFAADAFAAQVSDAVALTQALVKLYRDNASTLTPDPLYAAFYYSHPPPLARLARLEKT